MWGERELTIPQVWNPGFWPGWEPRVPHPAADNQAVLGVPQKGPVGCRGCARVWPSPSLLFFSLWPLGVQTSMGRSVPRVLFGELGVPTCGDLSLWGQGLHPCPPSPFLWPLTQSVSPPPQKAPPAPTAFLECEGGTELAQDPPPEGRGAAEATSSACPRYQNPFLKQCLVCCVALGSCGPLGARVRRPLSGAAAAQPLQQGTAKAHPHPEHHRPHP